MSFTLEFTNQADCDLKKLETTKNLQKRLKAVRKALGLLEVNPKHPRLHTHKYDSIKGINGEEIFEAYAENITPAAFRIFWHYGSGKDVIPVIAITAHP